MDLVTLLVLLAITLLVGAYVARPLLLHEGRSVSQAERSYSELEAERERLLNAILELDMDWSLGKLAEEDYRRKRSAMVLQAADVYRQLDQRPRPEGESAEPADLKVLDDQIEAEVARLRGVAEKPDSFCTACGETLQPGDKFCAKCGTLFLKAARVES